MAFSEQPGLVQLGIHTSLKLLGRPEHLWHGIREPSRLLQQMETGKHGGSGETYGASTAGKQSAVYISYLDLYMNLFVFSQHQRQVSAAARRRRRRPATRARGAVLSHLGPSKNRLHLHLPLPAADPGQLSPPSRSTVWRKPSRGTLIWEPRTKLSSAKD